MTRKDFEKIAATLKASKPIDSTLKYVEESLWLDMVHRFANTLALDNAGFKRNLFLKAAGV